MVKLEKDPLLMSTNYFDDVITMSFTKPTYEITLDSHIELLELAVERLAFHGAKINVNKCDFAREAFFFLDGMFATISYVLTHAELRKFKLLNSPKIKKECMHFWVSLIA